MAYFNLVKKEEHWQLVKLSEKGDSSVVFVPSEYIHFIQINLPISSKNQLQKAIPYAIEPELAQPLDTLHFVMSEQDKKGNISVCVIDKKLMKLWHKACQSENANILLLPDIFMLPYEPRAWVLLKQENRYLVRSGYNQGFVIFQLEHLSFLLQQNPIAIEKILSFDAGDLANVCCVVEERHFNMEENLNFNYMALKNFNLLQGEFVVAQEAQSSWLFRWSTSFYLIFLIFFVWGIGNGIQTVILSKHKNNLDGKIEKIYHQYFPDSGEMSEPELRLRNLSNPKTVYDPYYLKVLLAIQEITKAYPTIHIEKLDYTRNRMLLTFAGDDEDFYLLVGQRLAPLGQVKQQGKQAILIEWGS